MKSRGIVFYVAGSRINYMIPVAIYSLKKYYKGSICFIVDPDFSKEVRKQINMVPDCSCIEDAMKHPYKQRGIISLWCRKAWHHIGQYPFNTNLYYDLDHIWLNEFDYSVFDEIEKYGLVCTSADLNPSRCGRKKKAAERCIGETLPSFHAINGGCAGAVKNSPQAHAWADMIVKTKVAPLLRKNPEEFAMCILKAQGIVGTVSYKWSMPISPRSFRYKDFMKKLNPHIALHCTRGTFLRSSKWCTTFLDVYKSDFMGLRTRREQYRINDHSLKLINTGANNGV